MPGTQSRLAAAVLSAMLLAAGCLGENSDVTDPQLDLRSVPGVKGVTVLLTDAPGDLEKAVVTISELYFMGDGGRITLLDQDFTTDMLTLQNDFATVVQGVIVPPGSYSQLRAVISGAYIEVEAAGGNRIFASSPNYAGLPSGATVDGALQLPSWGSSGLKIEMPNGSLEVGQGQTIVLIDFDVEESFGHEAGKSGRWVMRPRITATNVTFGGNVLAQLKLGSGITLPAVAGQPVTLGAFSAQLTPAGGGATQSIQLSDANNDGTFEALFTALVPGVYTLDFARPAGLILAFDPALPRTVSVSSNHTTTETVTITLAQLAGSITATLRLATGVTLPNVGGNPATIGQFKAQLTPAVGAATQVSFTDANNDGTFEATFGNLVAGDYSLTLLPPTGVNTTFNPAVPVAVTLAAGANDTRAFTITAASAQ